MTLSNIVLVGVDGSLESGAALTYAVAEANRRGARLRVVSTYFPEYAVHGRTRPLTASETGIVNEKVAPRPSSDSTRISPPWPSTMCRAIASPSPVPPPDVRVRSAL